MLDWRIIGGGTHLSLYLTRRLRVLDPHKALLARRDATVANVGMEFLRSSHAHNRHIAEVEHAAVKHGRMALELAQGEGNIETDPAILATGFESTRPGGPWLDRVIAEYDLPYAPCGYPIVDKTLCWRRGLYVTGALAELEIGPVSRNIIGAAGLRAPLAVAIQRAMRLPTGVIFMNAGASVLHYSPG